MIYLDNAATTLKKPYAVRREMAECMKHFCANSGRGGHRLSILAGERVYDCREKLAKLFNVSDPANIVFTANTTMALNFAIKGILKNVNHVVISGMEHNSVLRPIIHSGVSYSIAKPNSKGFVTAKSVEDAIDCDTGLIVVTHASNIVGTINPISEIGEVAKKHNIPFLVDAAQTAGVIPIDVEWDKISMLAFAGHKMLYGPTGTGGLYVSPNIKLNTIIEGGTGSLSESYIQPDFMPDHLESGTLNTVGIVGLLEGVKFVLNNTPEAIHQKEMHLTKKLISELKNIKGVNVYGADERVGVVGFSVDGIDSVTVCTKLDEDYNIASRGGMHCAAIAHQSMGTAKMGLARLSVSYFTKMNEIDKAINAVNKISKK